MIQQKDINVGFVSLSTRLKKRIKVPSFKYQLRANAAYYYPTSSFGELKNLIEGKSCAMIYGLLGTGKTQLALHYANDFLKTNPYDSFVACVRADTLSLLENDLIDLAKKFEVITQIPFLYSPEKIVLYLNDIIQNYFENSLVVYDNANYSTFTDIERLWLPSLANLAHKRLVTTTNGMLNSEIASFRLIGFNPEEAMDFLLYETNLLNNQTEKEAIESIINDLNGLPLGLAAVKMYVKNKKKTYADYLKILKNPSLHYVIEKELDILLSSSYSKPSGKRALYTALTELINLVKEKVIEVNEKKIKPISLLYEISYLNADGIPSNLIQEFIKIEYEASDNSYEIIIFDQLINELECYSLVFQERLPNFSYSMISIHRTVKKLLINELTLKKHVNYFGIVLHGLAACFIKDTRDPKSFEFNFILLPHVEEILEIFDTLNYLETDQMLLGLKLADRLGYFYTQTGTYQNALPQLEKSKKLCEKIACIDNNFSSLFNTISSTTVKDQKDLYLTPLQQKNLDQIYYKLKNSYKVNMILYEYISIVYTLGRMRFYPV